jgi:hypothetical protein
MNFLSNSSAETAENTLEGTSHPEREDRQLKAANAYVTEKGKNMSVAVIPADGTEPIASFPDMATAMAWGLQQYKGQPFVVRVFAEDAEAGDIAASVLPKENSPRRRPATKAAAVASVLRAARKAEREEFRHDTGSRLTAASH